VRVIYFDSQPSLITSLAALALWSGTLVLAGLVALRGFYPYVAGGIDKLVSRLTFAKYIFADGACSSRTKRAGC